MNLNRNGLMPDPVGSRASNLTRAQVREYLDPLRERFPRITFTHRVILEDGDKDRNSRLSDVSAISGDSAFSSEQEAALSRGMSMSSFTH